MVSLTDFKMICSYNAKRAYQNKIRRSSTRLLADGGCVWVFSYGTHSQNSSKDKTSVDSKLEEVVNIIYSSSSELRGVLATTTPTAARTAKIIIFKKGRSPSLRDYEAKFSSCT